MTKISVLIAEDNEDFARLLKAYLETCDQIEVTGMALDGKQAVRLAEDVKPDVLLLDLILPDIDGIEVLRRIHEKDAPPKTIVISAIGNDEKIYQMTNEFGIRRFFVKPFDMNMLTPAIHEANR